MENKDIKINIINNVFRCAVGNERQRILEIAQEQYEWVTKEDNADKAPSKVIKPQVANRGQR
jgi:hypothetical protein